MGGNFVDFKKTFLKFQTNRTPTFRGALEEIVIKKDPKSFEN